MKKKKEDIAYENDRFRRRHVVLFDTGAGSIDELPGMLVQTAGVNLLIREGNPQDALNLIGQVQNFDTFTEDNDPHGEHDFGKVTVVDVDYFWKIDYFANEECNEGCDPYEDKYVFRVLTIMRADEY